MAINPLSHSRIEELVRGACRAEAYRNKRVLVIIPDNTRTAPVGEVFACLHQAIGAAARAFDVLIALGTHPPMSDAAICERLEITPAEKEQRFAGVRFFNHAWDNPAELTRVGTLGRDEVAELTGGLFSMEVPVEINRRLFDYDEVIILGPVFPHEVVGFSGGNKYLFPGVGGPQILNFFHWLGAIVTNPEIIGKQDTPVRRVVDRAASMVRVNKLCLAMVVTPAKQLAGLFVGTPEDAWRQASALSRDIHITYKDKPFHTILSCCPPMYDELWTAGKCMYKLEPVLTDGGELIIYAPHLKEISVTHGRYIEAIGYHCRDYFLKQWDKFKDMPWGVLAHSTHVRGLGKFENGTETCRATVTLASQVSPERCRKLNLGFRDPKSLRPEDYAGREAEGVLLVPKAGEMLFRLRETSQAT